MGDAGLHIAEGVVLPIDYVTKTAAILAQRRKGKTYTGAVLAEELVAATLPFVALDPTGAWWGLRSSADGKTAGLPVVVIGGQHGDLPLERGAGAVVADLVLDHPGYYVLDLSLLESRAAERDFSLAFALRLYRRKMEPGMDFPLHLFVDEADLFVPQERETKQDNLVLGAFSAIIRRGGLHGLGSTLISQRPALVNKGALTQLDLLVLLRLVAGQDQEAIFKDYVKRHGTKEQQATLMDSLASLPVGVAWLWEPGADPPLFERVSIRERRTFNSSATPKVGERRVEPKVLADIDLDALLERMEASVERAKQDDPVELRRRLRDAERELADWRGTPVATEQVVETVEIPVFPEPLKESIRQDYASLASYFDGAKGHLDEMLARAGERLDADFGLSLEIEARKSEREKVPPQRPSAQRPPAEQAELGRPASPRSDTNGDLSTGAKHLLQTLAQHHPLRLSTGQLALLARRKARGGAWNTAMKQLRDGGYLVEEAGDVYLTDLGVDESGATTATISSDERLERFREALPAAALDIFDRLVAVWPEGLSTDELAAATGRTPRGGSWNSAIATLVRNGLAVKIDDGLAATEEAVGR